MKTIARLLSTLAAILLFASCNPAVKEVKPYNEGINILPIPRQLEVTAEGKLPITKQTTFVAQGDSLRTIAAFFAEKIKLSTGYDLKIVESSTAPAKEITLSLVGTDAIPNAEGYTLEVTKEGGVVIKGSTPKGVFYGMQTLLQLLPAEIESPTVVNTVEWGIPFVSIVDDPRFAYRGSHFDVCRHFLPIEVMKRNIDVLSMLKINILHWHLTDDQGWRIEIKKYPKLTEIGAQRTEGDGSTYGPYFYTQEQVKEIVAYAQERFVEIVPEIEMPGHAQAALAAYPNLGCYGADHKYDVRIIWGISDDVFCAGNDEVFEFLENVIDEVAPLFPSKYFHIGGDECPKTRWKACPKCQQRIRDEKLRDEHELQSYFIHRMERVVLKHDKRMIGWEEILEGGLAPSATVMSWTGEEGGITSANMGHDVIMTPASNGLYIDHYQGDPKIEPLAICCYAPMSKIYSYNPIPDAIAPERRHHVLGVQANVWAEYLYTPEQREYMAYPRTLALAEIAWSSLDRKNYDDFLRRIENTQVRLDMHGVNYFIPQPEQPGGSLNKITITDLPGRETATLEFTTVYPVKVVYTTDGTEPTETSNVYSGALSFDQPTTLKIRSVTLSGKMSPVRTIEVVREEASPATTTMESEEFASVFRPGLAVRFVDNKAFSSADELIAYEGEAVQRIATDMRNEVQRIYNPDGTEYKFGAIYTGFFNVPADGVYVFSTDQSKLWIDGREVISNEGEPKKLSRRDTSIALKAGLHEIRFVNIGMIEGGWPTGWNSIQVSFRPLDATSPFTQINEYYHKASM